MVAAFVLAALGWAWTPVEEADQYEMWCAHWREPWALCGHAPQEPTPALLDQEFFNEPTPIPGSFVCYTVRATKNLDCAEDGEVARSPLPPCCGPCRIRLERQEP
jgi:hypothetical protein